jgi:hypothetical protein
MVGDRSMEKEQKVSLNELQVGRVAGRQSKPRLKLCREFTGA